MHGDARLQGEVHQLADLVGVGARERAAEDREVLREDGDLAAVDLAPAGDDAVSENLLPIHVEVGAAVGDEAVGLDERARVAEQLDALAGGELAGLVLLVDARSSATELGTTVELFEVGERGQRLTRVVRHVLEEAGFEEESEKPGSGRARPAKSAVLRALVDASATALVLRLQLRLESRGLLAVGLPRAFGKHQKHGVLSRDERLGSKGDGP